MDAISNVIAVEEGPRGIRSNVIAPGPIGNTEGMARLMNNSESKYKSVLPLGRMGDIKDVANATVFLFSDAASWLTGQIIAVDGGSEVSHVPLRFKVRSVLIYSSQHLRGFQLPYPDAVLDPMSVAHMFKGKL